MQEIEIYSHRSFHIITSCIYKTLNTEILYNYETLVHRRIKNQCIKILSFSKWQYYAVLHNSVCVRPNVIFYQHNLATVTILLWRMVSVKNNSFLQPKHISLFLHLSLLTFLYSTISSYDCDG